MREDEFELHNTEPTRWAVSEERLQKVKSR